MEIGATAADTGTVGSDLGVASRTTMTMAQISIGARKYRTLAEAVAAARPGETILVGPGTLVLQSSLVLDAQGVCVIWVHEAPHATLMVPGRTIWRDYASD